MRSILGGVTAWAAVCLLSGCGNGTKTPPKSSNNAVPPPVQQGAEGGSSQRLPDGTIFEVRGVRVIAPPRGNESDEMRAFNMFPGTSVGLCIHRPQGGIIALDHDASTIESFRDERGTDLWKGPKAGQWANSSIDMMPKISPDGKKMIFEVSAQGVPASGARTLTVKGTARIKAATTKQDHTADGVALAAGTKFKTGGIEWEIEKAGKPEWGGDEPLAVTFTIKREMSDVAEVKFFDAAGQPIEASRQMSSWSGSGAHRVTSWTYLFQSKVGKAKVVITQWTDMQDVEVPFELSFGVGL